MTSLPPGSFLFRTKESDPTDVVRSLLCTPGVVGDRRPTRMIPGVPGELAAPEAQGEQAVPEERRCPLV